MVFRIGSGHDTHRLAEGRPLILGGMRIAHPRGLDGHSDADVVLHAITDAMLGAAGLGDIGDAYPDTDPAYRDCDSAWFVRDTLERLNRDGWRIVNLDVIVFAQEPKLGPVKAAIRSSLAELLGGQITFESQSGRGSILGLRSGGHQAHARQQRKFISCQEGWKSPVFVWNHGAHDFSQA